MWICCITPLIVFDAHAPIDPKIVHLVLTICNCVFPEHTISMQFVSVIASRCVNPCLNLRTRCFWICCRDLFRFAHGAQFSRRVLVVVVLVEHSLPHSPSLPRLRFNFWLLSVLLPPTLHKFLTFHISHFCR